MTPNELLGRLRAPEDNFVERKSAGIKPAEIRKALAAFSNSLPDNAKAVIFIGVGDKGGVDGCPNTDALQKAVRHEGEACYPPIRPICIVLSVEGKDVLAVVVSSSKDKPHFTGPAFVRRGSESVIASKELFEALVNTRMSKVEAILKLKDMAITVFGVGHRLGKIERVEAHYREQEECKVTACDAHLATFLRLNDSWEFYEPVERIQLSRDGNMKRPALIVTGV